MNNEEIKRYINNNGGITLDQNKKSVNNKNGYVVSFEGKEKKYYNINECINKIDDYIKFINNKVNCYVGIWYNANDNMYYLDISTIIKSKKEALRFGKKNKQLAIYDIKNDDYIDVIYKLTFYTLYNLDMQPIKQYDKIDEIISDLGITKKEIYKAIKNNSIIKCKYYLFCDKMLSSEL